MGSGLRQKLEALFLLPLPLYSQCVGKCNQGRGGPPSGAHYFMNTNPDAYAFCCMPYYKVCRPEVSEFFESNHYTKQPKTHEAQPWGEVIAEQMLEGEPLEEKQAAWERFVNHLRDLKKAREEAGSLLNENSSCM